MRGLFIFRAAVLSSMFLLCGWAMAQDQSLGDLARQQRQQQNRKPKRVVTNEDLPHVAVEEKTADTAKAAPNQQTAAADAATGASMLRQNVENERYLTERAATFEKQKEQAQTQSERDNIESSLKNYREALRQNKLQRKFLEESVKESKTADAAKTDAGSDGKSSGTAEAAN
jgi:hypothetical protein